MVSYSLSEKIIFGDKKKGIDQKYDEQDVKKSVLVKCR
jgi:hypothetical protein